MKFDYAPYTRVFLRYLIGYLTVKGFLPEEVSQMITNDPELLMILNAAVGVALFGIVEGWYRLAKKYNWKT